jgi:putative FmdB family regulatory protein
VPVYEYRCGSGHHYEKTEGFDAPREQACPVCGTMARRQISLPAVIFKGPGFYSTDNRSSSRSGNGKSSESETSTSAGDAHGHSHDEDGHSHGGAASKAEATATD